MSSPTSELHVGQMQTATLGDLVAAGAARLAAAGIEEPEREAWLLLAHVIGGDWPALRLRRAEEPAVAAQQAFAALVAPRAQREPLAYIIGETEFMGLKVKCRPGVFIPRPETEVLVECVLGYVRQWPPVVAADVGCGTGSIACALAHFLPQAQVEAIDPSPAAVELTRENASALRLSEQVRCRQGRFLEPLALDERSALNCVVCNPPYVARSEFAALQPEVLAEPRPALDGGDDGLDFYRAFLPRLAEVGGERLLAAFEVGQGQAQVVERMLAQVARFTWTEIRRDYADMERIVLAGTEGTG